MITRSTQKRIRRPVNKKLRDQIFERDNYRCRLNGPRCSGMADEIDHINGYQSLIDSGVRKEFVDSPDNLQTSCVHCNRQKGKLSMSEFLNKYGK